ncbi:spermidine synthase [Pseudooceanicola batsensis HTCC2597]|uniref:Polyamine aminopropyltransferase n=1 Tax=Pseudooceanicola batsensis (strain ATCC BAA-863 / DSM 15984 / KCTC 12145 / HTCC2597) TaxID=252305 RepID=A3TUI0_PSEBH|nr:spermidine synthase [Pseudooceanicola batsensis HTCC2597]
MQPREVWLLTATFLVAVAGLIYELIAATLSSYLLGDSVRQFSFVIGIFLASMGLGAWVSRYVRDPLPGFVWAQILLGIAGGFLAPVVFGLYAWTGEVAVPLYSLLIAVGILSGMEIPLIARTLHGIGAPEFRFENVLSFDYLGALAASLAFPVLIIPHLGLMSASLAFGALNLAVAALSLWIFRRDLSLAPLAVWAVAAVATGLGLWQAERIVSLTEAQLYEDDVILSEDTAYQHITVTRFRDRIRLFLDHSIQFDSYDEYRYHEALVHPAMGLVPAPKRVLILGGGDGMALREVLRHPVEAVTLVDLDPRVTEIFSSHPDLAALNGHSYDDPRLTAVNFDAWRFVEDTEEAYDVIILDLPDPKTLALSKLYSREFYAMLVDRLAAGGAVVTQAGSPFYARQAFWSIVETWEATRNPYAPGAGLNVIPYHALVPSFGDWGFVLATVEDPAPRPLPLPEGLGFLTRGTWAAAQSFDGDTDRIAARVNSIRDHALLGFYVGAWEKWFR